jgi:NAD(P)-dependent dehydrogenase (short-subunit alcohol dehydrogenase family)
VWYNAQMPTAQHVVITGATSGIGRATALKFARSGAFILAVGRDTQALEELRRDAGGQVAILQVDVTAEASPDAIVDAARREIGGITTLVNAAGIIAPGSVETTSDEQWDTMLDVNLRAPFRLMRAVSALLPSPGGSIVNVSSVTGVRAFPNVLAYCVSKAGVDQLTRCAALELAPRGIRVNAVNPGVVVTNLHRRSGMTEENYAAFLERSRETHPLGRAGDPNEIAELIYFLASDAAAWITGETISVDGGRHLTCAR